MKIQTRNKKIKESKLSVSELAKKYGLSYERTRQIKYYSNREEKLKKDFEKMNEIYQKRVKFIVRKYLKREIERLKGKGRSKIIVAQKVILIKCLRDYYSYSFAEIARLFENDYSTIIHLYKKS